MSGSFVERESNCMSSFAIFAIPGLKVETRGTPLLLRKLVNQDEQGKSDTEDEQRNKEMAVSENSSSLFKRSHRCGILRLVRANITGARAVLSSSREALDAERPAPNPTEPDAERNESFLPPGIGFKAIR